MKTQTQMAYYPKYYGELSVQVFAPQFYYSKSQKVDYYSKQVVDGKTQDLSSYFLEPVKAVFVKLPFKPNLIVMVPSHQKGKFSPTLHSLALRLYRDFRIPYANVIERIKEGKKLTSCEGRDERYEQVNGAFEVDSTIYSLNRLKIVLLDDTKTTGFTTLECTKELRAVGAMDVVGVCLGINAHEG
jgi:predicted amidophosphoribosyltransferase